MKKIYQNHLKGEKAGVAIFFLKKNLFFERECADRGAEGEKLRWSQRWGPAQDPGDRDLSQNRGGQML